MKKIILLFTFCLLLYSSYSQDRYVLTIDGMTTTSGTGFDGVINGAKNINGQGSGFKIKSLNNTISLSSIYNPSDGVAASVESLNKGIAPTEATDVLGIAHDFGGIVMRNMKSSNISAMILDGVPNRGSQAIKEIIRKDSDGKYRVQKIFADMKKLTGAGDCADCNIETRLNDFLEHIQAAEKGYKDILPDSKFVNAGNPTVPYAIMWGNISKNSLSSMVSSFASPVDVNTNFYGKCITEQINTKIAKKEREKNRLIISSVFTIFTDVVNLLTPVKVTNEVKDKDGNITTAFSITGVSIDKVTTLVKDIVTSIQQSKDLSEELKNLLKCELYMQTMSGLWEYLVSQNQFITLKYEWTVDLFNCLEDCNNLSDDPPSKSMCMAECNQLYANQTTTVTAYALRPNDGLLTDYEQQLDGAAKTYELKEVNHYQEQNWFQGPVQAAFVDLFNGGAGVAFKIPK